MTYDLREGDFTFKYVSEKNPMSNKKLVKDHFHTQYELLYVLKGNGIFSIQQNKYKIFSNCLLVIKPGMFHHVNIDEDSEYERIVVRFNSTDVVGDLIKNLETRTEVYNIKNTRLAEEFLRLQIYNDDLSKNCKNNLMLIFKNHLSVILAYLGNLSELKIQADYKNQTVETVISYIEKNLVQIESIEQICGDLHISKSLMQRRFYEQMNTSVMAYVRTQKCLMARDLLQKGFSATYACMECWSGDYSSFYRAYKKVFGQSPADTLRMKKNSADKFHL